MPKQNFSKEFIELIASITNKRAKIVIDHIIQHNFITTEDLETIYGYKHPPRAARDVREAGIPLETFKVKSDKGKSIAAYRFGDLDKIQQHKIAGRYTFSKVFKNKLYLLSNSRCAICHGIFEERYLQIDHKVPYQIGGDDDNFQQKTENYMLLCASCNRCKSWSCEHCKNWNEEKEKNICLSCYWGNPNEYKHIALKDIRRLELIWQGKEIAFFDVLNQEANQMGLKLPEYIKKLIENFLNKK